MVDKDFYKNPKWHKEEFKRCYQKCVQSNIDMPQLRVYPARVSNWIAFVDENKLDIFYKEQNYD